MTLTVDLETCPVQPTLNKAPFNFSVLKLVLSPKSGELKGTATLLLLQIQLVLLIGPTIEELKVPLLLAAQ